MNSIKMKKINSLEEIQSMYNFWKTEISLYKDNLTILEEYKIEEKCDKEYVAREMDTSIYEKYKVVSKNKPFASYVVLLSAFQILCSRYQDSNNEIVITPAYGTSNTIGQGKAGNWVFIRSDIEEGDTFRKFLNGNLIKVKEIFSKQFCNIQELFNNKDNASLKNTLFKNLFVFENMQSISAVEEYIHSKENDFSLVVKECDTSLGIKYFYDPAVLDKEDAECFLVQYEDFLNKAISNMDMQIVKFLLFEEKPLQQAKLIDTTEGLKELLLKKVSSYTEKIAVYDQDRRITYSQIFQSISEGSKVLGLGAADLAALFIIASELAEVCAISEHDVFAVASSLEYVDTYKGILASLFAGAEIHLIPDNVFTNANKLYRYIFTNKITCLRCSSIQYSALLNTTSYKKNKFSQVLTKVIVSDDYFILEDLKHSIQENTIKLYCEYNIFGDCYKTLINEFKGKSDIRNNGAAIGNWFVEVRNKYGMRQFSLGKGTIYQSNFNNAEETLFETGIKGFIKNSCDLYVTYNSRDYGFYKGKRFNVHSFENELLKNNDIKHVKFILDENANLEFIYSVSVDKDVSSEIFCNYAKNIFNTQDKIKWISSMKMPINSQGKADEKVIREIADTSYEIQEVSSPHNQKEKSVLEVVQNILGDKTINMNSNFFDFGGDSIKAIQICGHLRQIGYKLDLADILKYQVVSKIVEFAKAETNIYEQGLYEGEAKLLPVQKRFFINQEQVYNRFNHSITLVHKEGIDEEAALKAYEDIVQHHDALRLSCDIRKDGIYQVISKDKLDNYTFEIAKLTGITNVKTVIEDSIDLMQRQLDIFKGKLSYVKIFKTDEGDYLTISIHHMVVDGISWRIILEDFMKAYYQHKSGIDVLLPAKSAPFLDWVKIVSDYAMNVPEWKEQYWNKVSAVEQKAEKFTINNSWKKHKEKVLSLGTAESELIIKKSKAAFHTETQDILVTALSLALAKWQNTEQTMLMLEGHGRERSVSNLDVSRTVGWFTSYYPVIIQKDDDVLRQIRNVRKAFLDIPERGITYGIIKYLKNNCQRFDLVKNQILFNYLGEADDLLGGEFILAEGLRRENSIHEDYDTGFLIAINTIMINHEIQFTIDYNTDMYREDEIDRLIHRLRESLDHIVAVGLDCIDKNLCRFELVELTEKEMESIDTAFGADNVEDVMPLSLMQEGMYFHWKISSEKDMYCEQYMYELEGVLEKEIFNNSIDELVKNNQIFRTIIIESGMNQIYQVILKNMSVLPKYVYFQESTHIEDDISEFRNIERLVGFDLNNGPMIKISVLEQGSNSFYILLSFHHIIMDGWSVPVILKELLNIYLSKKSKQPESFGTKMQFKDYIRWFNKQNTCESIYFWKNYLGAVDTVTILPFQKKNGKTGFAIGKYVNVLSKVEEERLTTFARKHGVTLYQLFQCMWSVLLSKYNRHSNIVFGTVVSGRPADLKGSEEIVGLCINTVPIVQSIDGKITFEVLLERINEVDINKYSFYPLAEIQNLSALKNELISHILIFENYPLDEKLKSGEYVEQMGFAFKNVDEFWKTNYDFNLMIVPNNGIEMTVIFNENKFPLDSIEKIMSHFQNTIHNILDNPGTTISDISILSEEERTSLIKKAYNCRFDLADAMPIYKQIEASSLEYGEKPAVIYEGIQLSYSELNKRANTYAENLKALAVTKNEVIGVLMKRTHKMIAVLLGILKCGCAYLPLDKSNPRERLNYMLEDSKVEYLFVSDNYDELTDFKGNYLYADEIWERDNYYPNTEDIGDINELMYMIYTSGSTGKPKGVCLEHKSVFNFMKSMKLEIPYSDVVMLCVTTMSFDIFGMEIYFPLINGQQIVIANEEEQLNPDSLATVIINNAVNMIQMTPSRMKIFLTSSRVEEALSKVNVIILGGEQLTIELVEKVKTMTNARIFNLYGPTETTIWSSCCEVTNAEDITIGKPIGNNSFYVVDNYNQLVPDGILGELIIGGDGLARGYYNSEDITNEKFVPNVFEGTGRMYKTGDIVTRLPNGNICYVERKDFQLKIHGFRIELGEIENCLKSELHWKDVIVLPLSKSNENILVGYYVGDSKVHYESIVEKLSVKLPYYMIPTYFVKVESIPTNVNGKIDRAALKSIAVDERESKKCILPENELEQRIYDIWRKHLEVEELDVNDNFFAIGGHSLKAVKVCSALKNNGFDVGINDLFRLRTVREMTNYLQNNPKIDDKINSIDKMISFLEERFKVIYLSNITDNGKEYRLLKLNIPENALEQAKAVIDTNINKVVKPDYIFTFSSYERIASLMETRNETIKNEINKDIKAIEANQQIMRRNLENMSTTKKYSISGAQKLRMLDPQNIITYFEIDDSLIKVKDAILQVINEQDLLRCLMVKQDDHYYWEQHDKFDEIQIVMIDLSYMKPSESDYVIKEIVAYMFRQQYDGTLGSMFNIAHIKISENIKRILLVCNHMIFDGYSSEVFMRGVKQKLLNVQDERKINQFYDYIKSVKTGPKNINLDKIAGIFEFSRYNKAVDKLSSQIKEYNVNKSTVLHYDIPLHPELIDKLNIFEISFCIFKLYIERYFNLIDYPVISINYGRRYEGMSYFDTIGEFIDYVPLVIDHKLSAKEFTDKIIYQNQILEKHNINLAEIAFDESLCGAMQEVHDFVGSLQEKYYFIFNYQGVENGNKEEISEIIDKETEYQMRNAIRFSSKIVDHSLNIYVYMPFELSENYENLFKMDSAELVKCYTEGTGNQYEK